MILAAIVALVTLAAGYEHNGKYSVTGGVYVDEGGNYSVRAQYWIADMDIRDQDLLRQKVDNQTFFAVAVELINTTTGEDGYRWTFIVPGHGYIYNHKLFIDSDMSIPGPMGKWKYRGLLGIEVIEAKPYLMF